MTVFIAFLAAAAAFAVGFLSGISAVPTKKPKAAVTKKDDGELEKIRREYANFLSYDGTDQEESADRL